MGKEKAGKTQTCREHKQQAAGLTEIQELDPFIQLLYKYKMNTYYANTGYRDEGTRAQ